ncbi:MAG: adenylate/guanylate cyclase domain-containing protein [Luteolibacter sp.]
MTIPKASATPPSHPGGWKHTCWLWGGTVIVAVLLWLNRENEQVVRGWLLLNVLVAATMLVWALGRIRTVFSARGTIIRWAFWPTLLITLSNAVGAAGAPGRDAVSWLPGGASYLLTLVVVFPVFLVGGVIAGMIGAGGAVMGGGGSLDRVAIARSGIRWIWVLLLVVYLVKLIPGVGGGYLIVGSIPWAFLCLRPLIGKGTRVALIGRFDLWLAKRLRWKLLGRTWDLRAEVFGTAGFLLAWALVSLKIFQPLQGSALLSAIQVVNATGIHKAPKPGRIVLLEWDAALLRAATTRESESAIQARMILRLAELRARRVVLPMPAERNLPDEQPSPIEDEEWFLPDLKQSELSRTERDMVALETAMRAAGNVVLLTPPPEAGPNPFFARLRPVAREIASPGFKPYLSPALPAIPFRWPEQSPPPAPLVLFAAQQENPGAFQPEINGNGTAQFAGKTFPVMNRDGDLLVDLADSRGSRDFAHVTYSEVLRGEWQFAPGDGMKSGRWVRPEEYFRDKIVILPPLRSISVPGPLGTVDATELLAQATRTLSGDRFLQPVRWRSVVLLSFAAALVIGRLAMRREPLKAGWRLLVTIGLILGVCFFVFIAENLCLDPIFPTVSALASFLLVTQLSFSLERAAKERNRMLLHRFVDPSIARELLDSQQSRLGLGGDRENVVILFADVRGFSRFAEAHPPEEVMRVVNAYLGVMTDALYARGGLLDKYTGDGLMAMFRLERQGSVAGAVDAALAMRDAALELSRELKAEGEKSLRVGISMHAGEAVVGLVGNAERQINFTALGHVVVVAARLQTLTGGGEVIVSKEVHDAVDGEFKMEPRPEVHVKGVSKPVKPYVVVGK